MTDPTSRRDPATDPPPEAPTLTLRDRKKAAAMRHIQHTALELFADRGFDRVTIEEIAAAAEVSPRTVYRYFETKEGLVLHDEFDDRVLGGFTYFLNQGLEPWEAVERSFDLIEEEHFVIDSGPTRQRLELFFDYPSVRAAGYLLIDEMADEVARHMADTGRWEFPQARIITSAILWSYIAAVKNWHEAGGGPILDHLRGALDGLRE